MVRKVYIENKPLQEALDLFIEHLSKSNFFEIESEKIPVIESLNRITAAPVFSVRSSPHYVAAAMDGIAVDAGLTFGACESSPVTLKKNQYVEVDTGDYVPPKYNAVIMIEDINFNNEGLEIIKPAVPWQHIRSVGEDLVAQEMLLPSLSSIGPYELASLLTAAIKSVKVVKKPRVAIIPTGTELVEQGALEMAPGEIVDSNSHMLASLCREWGAQPLRHSIVPDNPGLLEKAVASCTDVDMIVICSGSSAGREDFTAEIVKAKGQLLVHGLATRPGKPAVLGIIEGKPVIGVPGYPVSAQLIFALFARPVLYRKQGLVPPPPEELNCSVSRKIASSMGVDEFIYVNVARIGDKYIAYPLSRGAGITMSLVKADGAFCIDKSREGLQPGETCTVFLRRPRRIIDKTLVTIGSHDMSIDVLAEFLQSLYKVRLVSANTGSMGGVMALSRAETHFAGIHLLDPASGDYNVSYLKKYLPDKDWLLLNMVKREQGIMVKKGNPLRINGLQDLLREKVRFINRQNGAGTRILFDYLLKRENISTQRINGYNREEYTHLAVAAAVKSDACDCGIGIYASAKAMNLDFIPLAEERYDLCILPEFCNDSTINQLISILENKRFRNCIREMGGYSLDLSGQILYSNRK